MKFGPDEFLLIKAAYPKRAKGKAYGWPEAFKQIQARVKEGHSVESILEGTKAYCSACKLSGDYGTEFVKMASTFYGKGLHFLDEYETEDPEQERVYRKPEEYTEEQRKADEAKAWKELNRLKGVR